MVKKTLIFLFAFFLQIFSQKPPGTLPVEIYYFEAEIADSLILIKWGTATEINNFGFNVERGNFDMSQWETLGFVEGHGTSFSPKDYMFDDTTAVMNEIYNYRLLQIDNDGGTKYSDTISVSFITSVEEELNNPAGFLLNQNYPNPFNPSTKISWYSPISSRQGLKIYDVLGKEVAALFDEYRPAGEYEVEFNAANLPSGLYFYTLSIGNFSSTKKLTLLK